jgi:hypothetical protein
MPDWNLVDRSHVLAAIAEYDRLGPREFLARYRFGRAKASTLWHGGQEYDSKAILGYAYLGATGRAATRDDFEGENANARLLKSLGFDVVVDEEALEQEERLSQTRAAEGTTRSTPATRTAKKAPAARKAAAKKPARVKPAEREVKVCPTCYMALPATGVCDTCG